MILFRVNYLCIDRVWVIGWKYEMMGLILIFRLWNYVVMKGVVILIGIWIYSIYMYFFISFLIIF